MAYPHGRAEVDTSSPRAWGVCDHCYFVYNLYTLTFQREWAGTTQINKGRLVCERCLDELQPQLRTIIIPADPPPIFDARTEPFALDEAAPAQPVGSALDFSKAANSQMVILFPFGSIG